MIIDTLPKKETRWTLRLIKRLRGNRTQTEMAELIDSSAEEIELWESRQAEPSEDQMKKLSELAERERFLRDWKLAGSGVLLVDLEDALRKQREEINKLLDDRALRLRG